MQWDSRELFPSDAAARHAMEQFAAAITGWSSGPTFTGDVSDVAKRLTELDGLRQRGQLLAAYGAVRFAVAMSDPDANDISSDIDQVSILADELFSIVTAEWAALDDQTAERLLRAPELAAYRGALAAGRRYRSDLPAAEISQALSVREPLADAWADAYELIAGAICVDDALAQGADPDPVVRRKAADELNDALHSQADLLAHCYDTVVADRLVLDRYHHRTSPRQHSDQANQLEPEAVDAALAAVAARFDIAHRWYATKAAGLGQHVLPYADLAAPVGDAGTYSLEQAQETVIGAFAGLDKDLAELVNQLFTTARVDADPRSGKMGNSLCVPAGAAPPFVLTNFSGRAADIITLGHEVGHAMHFTLSGGAQPGLVNEPTILTGEIAAIFAELLVMAELIHRNPAHQAALAAVRADSLIATVFRQTALTAFEQSAYAQRSAGAVLGADRLGRLWVDSMRALYGSTVDGFGEHDCDWALVPHFVRTRFYNYSYVLAALASLVLYGLERGRAAKAYLQLLAAGGSASTQEILTSIGTDAEDPRRWHAGLDALAELVGQVRW